MKKKYNKELLFFIQKQKRLKLLKKRADLKNLFLEKKY